jgi:hypothetical protein
MVRFLFLLILFLSMKVIAQAPDPELVTRNRPGILWFYDGFKSSKLTDARKYDRFIIDLIHSDWMTENTKPFTNHWASIGFNTQFLFDIPLTIKNSVSLGIGLGYGHTKIKSDKVVTNLNNSIQTQLVDKSTISGLEKSIFKTNVLFIPLELRFRTPGWQHFKFQVGGRVGMQMRAKTKNFSTQNGKKTLQKVVGFQDLNRFVLGVHTRIGIRNWAIIASYNLTPYFDVDKVNQINGMEIGLSISLF